MGVEVLNLPLRVLFGLLIVMITVICSTLIDETIDSKFPLLKGKISL